MTSFQRPVLPAGSAGRVVELLGGCLADLIDLALQLEQVDWKVVGETFLPDHEKLDEIVDTARTASDDVAERIVAIGHAADGRAASVAERSRLTALPEGFPSTATGVGHTADRLASTATGLRAATEAD